MLEKNINKPKMYFSWGSQNSLQKTPGLAGEEPDHLELSLNTWIPEKPLRTQWTRVAWNRVWTAGEQLWKPEICQSVCYPKMVFIFKMWPFIFPVLPKKLRECKRLCSPRNPAGGKGCGRGEGITFTSFSRLRFPCSLKLFWKKQTNKKKNRTTLKNKN